MNELIIRINLTNDLIIQTNTKLSFNDHICDTYKNCCKVLGFLIRMTRNFHNLDTIILLYNSYILSKLNYSSIIWSPTYHKYIYLLESLQKRFLKYLFFKKYIIYPDFTISYKCLLNEFNFTSLNSDKKVISLLYLLCINWFTT